MAQTIAVLIGVGLLAGAIWFIRHVVEQAYAQGKLPAPKTPPGGRPAKVTGKTTRAQVQRVRNTGTRVANTRRARTVRVIWAEALANNWLAGRAHRRANPKPPRRKWLVRVVAPRGGVLPASVTPGASPPGSTPAQAAPPAPATTAAPVSTAPPTQAPPSGGSPMTTPPPPTGGGAAGDFFSALHRLLAGAQAGGIRDKIRAHLGLGEGFGQQGAALEQHARYLRETGQYPPPVWEPVQQAAGFLRAAAGMMAESGNAVVTIAKTPAGELAGKAPHRDELVRG